MYGVNWCVALGRLTSDPVSYSADRLNCVSFRVDCSRGPYTQGNRTSTRNGARLWVHALQHHYDNVKLKAGDYAIAQGAIHPHPLISMQYTGSGYGLGLFAKQLAGVVNPEFRCSTFWANDCPCLITGKVLPPGAVWRESQSSGRPYCVFTILHEAEHLVDRQSRRARPTSRIPIMYMRDDEWSQRIRPGTQVVCRGKILNWALKSDQLRLFCEQLDIMSLPPEQKSEASPS